MIRNVQVEMSWLTLVRLVVITASLVTERRFVAPTGRLSFSMRLLDCIGKWGGFWTVWKPKKLIFWTKNSGIRYILHTFATTFAGSEVFCGLELLGTGSQKTFLNSSKDLFLKQVLQACHRRVWARIWPRLYSSPPEIGGRGDEVQRCHPPISPVEVFFCSLSWEELSWVTWKKTIYTPGWRLFPVGEKKIAFFFL